MSQHETPDEVRTLRGHAFNQSMNIVRDHHISIKTTWLISFDQDLFLGLKLINDFNRDLQNICNDVVGCKSKPLGKRNVFNSITFEVLNPDKLFGFRSVLDVMT